LQWADRAGDRRVGCCELRDERLDRRRDAQRDRRCGGRHGAEEWATKVFGDPNLDLAADAAACARMNPSCHAIHTQRHGSRFCSVRHLPLIAFLSICVSSYPPCSGASSQFCDFLLQEFVIFEFLQLSSDGNANLNISRLRPRAENERFLPPSSSAYPPRPKPTSRALVPLLLPPPPLPPLSPPRLQIHHQRPRDVASSISTGNLQKPPLLSSRLFSDGL
jgi:hypothetical protein